mmetsp:Transcript_33669/g.81550  ORF Transcript_33669/g.81550 Transcript_33669/m.81550 type:complete len:172 (+) Transcript_33669:23-538(+)
MPATSETQFVGPYFLGADCGSGSIRVAIVDVHGRIVSKATRDIETYNPSNDFYEQSSDEIWGKFVLATKEVLESSKIDPANIKGIGFDATCSLVVLDDQNEPLSISAKRRRGGKVWNIIMWRDHRASLEAEEINATNHEVLRYVGGKVSVEMQIPKLMWIKRHHKPLGLRG